VNTPPSFINVRDKYVKAGSLLSFGTGVDSDLPPQNLSFTMDAITAQGAAIDPVSGVFSWTPAGAQASTTHYVTVHVTDNGVPPLSASAIYTIHVLDSSGTLILVDLSRVGNTVVLNWPGTIGKVYQVQTKDNLNQPNWIPFGPNL